MANKVGLSEEEYANVVQSLKSAHNNSVSLVENAISQIGGLNGPGAAFDTEKITPQIQRVIGELNRLKGQLENVYHTHEEVVDSFQRSIDECDSIC
ncbi:hypothetical protein M2454_002454 [Aequitasia blattaphilus]|uniref:Uncharacterized protein n=1 Tax=Aequitasia blattaphilus TaxID=2949332 RepID=A0ABT1EB75_9FIRM|nr:hypothetical protein [Aequitasia blattaphilus]MCP1103068.1 hypothetical protein [Aequitasia blattaphilus]MCR8615708.1 hypothetical protein [Aequitasia blattaphilus]